MIVYSVDNLESFEMIENWKNRFITQSSIDPNKCPFLLLGNKSDLEDQRKISAHRGENFAKKNNMIFFETSALTGGNIEKAITQIARIAAENGSAPLFTEDVVAGIMNMDNDSGLLQTGQSYDGVNACPCLLL